LPGRQTGAARASPSCSPDGAVAYLAAECRCTTSTTTTTTAVEQRVPILAKLLNGDARRLIALALADRLCPLFYR
jgi:hypothetical protein